MFEEEQTEKEISFLLEEFGQSKESPFGRNYSFFFDSKFLFFQLLWPTLILFSLKQQKAKSLNLF